MTKKAIKLIRIFEDGNEEYIEGSELRKFIDFEKRAYTYALIHGLKCDEIKWKKKK